MTAITARILFAKLQAACVLHFIFIALESPAVVRESSCFTTFLD